MPINEGKKTRKPVIDGIKDKKKTERQVVQNTLTLKSRKKGFKRKN